MEDKNLKGNKIPSKEEIVKSWKDEDCSEERSILLEDVYQAKFGNLPKPTMMQSNLSYNQMLLRAIKRGTVINDTDYPQCDIAYIPEENKNED